MTAITLFTIQLLLKSAQRQRSALTMYGVEACTLFAGHLRIFNTDRPVLVISQVNTERTIHKHVGIRHMEGGWPENVDSTEIDQVDRYLKKALKVWSH
jgi:hypothetical protein